MTKEELRASLLETLHLTDAPKEEQMAILLLVEATANDRFALAVPDMLSEEQVKHVEAMRAEKKDDETIRQWIESQLDDYKGMMQGTILEVANEIAAGMQPA